MEDLARNVQDDAALACDALAGGADELVGDALADGADAGEWDSDQYQDRSGGAGSSRIRSGAWDLAMPTGGTGTGESNSQHQQPSSTAGAAAAAPAGPYDPSTGSASAPQVQSSDHTHPAAATVHLPNVERRGQKRLAPSADSGDNNGACAWLSSASGFEGVRAQDINDEVLNALPKEMRDFLRKQKSLALRVSKEHRRKMQKKRTISSFFNT